MPAEIPPARADRTRRLQLVTVVCSAVFVAGTFLQTFVFVDRELIETAAALSGMGPAEAAAFAPGFLTGFRWVGSLYVLGNAVGLSALRGGTGTFWTVLAVNATQAAGVVVLPDAVTRAMRLHDGGAAWVTTLVVDGGAVLLAVALLVSLVAYRRPWGRSPSARRPLPA